MHQRIFGRDPEKSEVEQVTAAEMVKPEEEAEPAPEAEPAAENRRGNLREQTLSFGATNPQTISTAPENPAGLILTWSDDETEGKTEAGDPGTEPGKRRPGAWAQSVGPTEQEPEAGARSSEHIEQEPPAGKQKKIVSLFGWRRKAQDRKSSRGGAFVRGAKTGAGSAGSLTGSGLEGAAVLASEAEALGGAVMGAALGAASADQASAPAKAVLSCSVSFFLLSMFQFTETPFKPFCSVFHSVTY